jgi:hypothetical protein
MSKNDADVYVLLKKLESQLENIMRVNKEFDKILTKKTIVKIKANDD